ncbi:hypothetical protein GCM10027020_14190 [Nocardioides salsibiostraticola]
MLLVAFGVAGTLWVFGLTVGDFSNDRKFVPLAAAYVLVFTWVIALKRLRTRVALLVAWAVAVLAGVVLMLNSDWSNGQAIYIGVMLGTYYFCFWALPSGLLLFCIDPDRVKALR